MYNNANAHLVGGGIQLQVNKYILLIINATLIEPDSPFSSLSNIMF